MEPNKHELSYFRLCLQQEMQAIGEPSFDDAFVEERVAAAEKEFLQSCRNGLTVEQAEERAMSVLLEGFR